MGYTLEGRLLEVCNCKIACPCWLGEDPDPGYCCGLRGEVVAVERAAITFNAIQGRFRFEA